MRGRIGVSWCSMVLMGLVAGEGKAQSRPLLFEENHGQVGGRARFVARGGAYDAFLTTAGVVLALHGGDAQVGISWSGARSNVPLVGHSPAASRTHYLVGNDPSAWVRDVPHFDEVWQRDLYPGIDVVFYGGGRDEVEFDFRVAPGADPGPVRFTLELGEESARPVTSVEGDLLIDTGSGTFRLRAPVVYQLGLDDERTVVPSRYVVSRDGADVQIQLEAFDRTRELVIDPVVSYSTFLGGGDREFGLHLVVDGAGNSYLTGSTESLDFPTLGGYSGALGGSSDGFIAKFDPSGHLVFSTYLGGSDTDYLEEVFVDAAGDVYFVGGTQSPDFPATPGSFQPSYGGDGDVTVGKLSHDGSTLLFASYLGGSNSEGTPGIAVDAAGHIYVAGQVLSEDFPTTPGSYQPVYPSGPGALLFNTFVTKLDAAASSLVYSTYLGGATSSSPGFDIAIDGAGHAYVTGSTGNTDFPTTPGAFQPSIADVGCPGTGCADGFVTKLSVDGSSLVYSTYLGGSDGDGGWALEVDAAGNAYVIGSTESPDFPVLGAAQPTHGGDFDAYLTKLDPTGSSLVFSTYLGGSGVDVGRGLDWDADGNLLIGGRTDSVDFPLVDPLQATNAGDFDAWVATLTPSGGSVTFASYLGGSGLDSAASTRFNAAGDMVLGGYTESADFPTTVDAFQATAGGTNDAFVSVISDPSVLAVGIDVRPRRRFNWIVPWLPWPMPVAILTSPTFDATLVDPSSVRFGPAGASALSSGRLLDVDRDGDDDLVLRFLMSETGIGCSDRTATLTGATWTGERFEGEDRVSPILCWPW